MLIVHVQNDGLRPPADRVAADGEIERWYPYVVDSEPHQIVLAAIEQLRERIINSPELVASCNASFLRFPNQLDFQTLFESEAQAHRVVISRCPTIAFWAVTLGRNISIAHRCFTPRQGLTPVELTAATLVHELAHVAGAPGDTPGGHYLAESVLLSCGYQNAFQRGGGG